MVITVTTLFLALVVVVVATLQSSLVMSTPVELQQQLAAAQQQNQELNTQYQNNLAHANAELARLQQQLQQQAAVSSSSSVRSPLQGQSSVVRIDLKPMQPKPFLGSVHSDVNGWITEFERYFAVAGIADYDSRRVPLAVTYLQGTASTWYTSLMLTELHDTPSWSEFKERFLARFQPLAASRMARVAIRNLRHRYRVAGYSQEFLKQMQLIPDMSAADQVETFIHGLQHRIAQEVDREMPKTLHEAMEIAQRVELRSSLRQPAYGRQMPFSRGDNQRESGDNMDLSMMDYGYDQDADFDYGEYRLNGMFQRGGGRGGRPSFHRGGRGGGRGGGPRMVPGLSRSDFDKLSQEGKCFQCKETGHIARNCPKAAAGGAPSSKSSN